MDGDGSAALVVDNGSGMVKAGFGGGYMAEPEAHEAPDDLTDAAESDDDES